MTKLPTLELDDVLAADVLATFGGAPGYLAWLAKNIESRYVMKAAADSDVDRESRRDTAIKAAEAKVVTKLAAAAGVEAVAAKPVTP